MKKLRPMALASLLCVLGQSMGAASAQTPAPTPAKTQVQASVYGSHLMTVQERTDYRKRMRELTSLEDRLQFQKEHQARMQDRAKARGVTLPDVPPVQAPGAGPREGSPPGMAPGAGSRGPGGGAGRP